MPAGLAGVVESQIEDVLEEFCAPPLATRGARDYFSRQPAQLEVLKSEIRKCMRGLFAESEDEERRAAGPASRSTSPGCSTRSPSVSLLGR